VFAPPPGGTQISFCLISVGTNQVVKLFNSFIETLSLIKCMLTVERNVFQLDSENLHLGQRVILCVEHVTSRLRS